MSFDQFLIDVFIARRDYSVSEDSLRSAWQEFLRNEATLRLSHILLNSGIVDQPTAERIDMQGEAYLQSLQMLAGSSPDLQVLPGDHLAAEVVSAWKSDSPAADAVPEYETLMEDSESGGATPQSTGSGSIGNPDLLGEHGAATRYRRERPHAEGGLGRVWLAADAELNRKVALKEIQPEHADEPSCRQRFMQEAAITGSLEHPGIVPVYGLGQHPDGRPFYAMRFIEGETMKAAIDHLHEGAPVHRYRHPDWRSRFRKLLDRFQDVCNTIEYAHAKGVIHRDIKPSNIMLGPFGETLVVDWGLAKQWNSAEDSEGLRLEPASSNDSQVPSPELTMHGTAIGTPAYMSPEQASGGRELPVTAQTDVYSLGATLFHLLTGQPPNQMRARADVVQPRQLVKDLPRPLEAICIKGMALQPEQRYRSAAELSSDLDLWLAGQAVSAYQERISERTSRWIRNHPTAITAAAIVGTLLFITSLVGVYGYQSYRNRIAQEQLERNRLAKSHVQQLLNSSASAVALAGVELRNNRFEAALGFLDSAIGQLSSEPQLADELPPVVERRDRLQRLVDFYSFTERAEELTFRDSSRRASILFQRGLTSVGVFQKRQWWDALPIEDLMPHQVHDIRTRVYRAMFLLTALRLKETIPADLDVTEMLKLASSQSERSNRASIVLCDLLDAYSRSQGAELGRRFANERATILTKALTALAFRQPLIEWKARNASDLYIMGAALGYMVINTDEDSRQPFESLLGVTDAEAVSKDMLTTVSDLHRDHYWTQLVRAFFEAQRGEHDAAWRSYSHAISLNPDNWVGYAWLAVDQRGRAIADVDRNDPRWLSLISRSSRNLEIAIDLNPESHQAHYERGHTLTWLIKDPREALASYTRAMFLQEPLEGIDDVVVEYVDRNYVTSVRNWCAGEIANWNYVELHASVAWSELLLGNNSAALESAAKAKQLQPQNQIARYVHAAAASRLGDFESAERELAELCRDVRWYPSLLEHGSNLLHLREYGLALAAFRDATEIAETGWQKLLAQQGLAQASMLSRTDDYLNQLQAAIDLAITERLDELMTIAQELFLADAVNLLTKHHQTLLPIVALRSEEPVRQAPLMNGGFELGLTRCWGDTLDKMDRPAWLRSGGSLAIASIDSSHVHDGQQALHIVDQGVQASDQPVGDSQSKRFGELSQAVSVEPGQHYQLEAWFYANETAPEAVVILADDQAVLTIPVATDRWAKAEARFTASDSEITIRIRCQNEVDVWIDSIRLTVAEPVQ
ncbi:MAG: protein kinase [Planctomycetales bacterium]|nr:protein kinase [Planctomycetales bacterium]